MQTADLPAGLPLVQAMKVALYQPEIQTYRADPVPAVVVDAVYPESSNVCRRFETHYSPSRGK